MTRFLALVAAFLALSLPVQAQSEDIVADLSQNAVQITATFVGSEILISAQSSAKARHQPTANWKSSSLSKAPHIR
jgi:vacuolar-type H+-ATPase catalytic subunit A/Vma1